MYAIAKRYENPKSLDHYCVHIYTRRQYTGYPFACTANGTYYITTESHSYALRFILLSVALSYNLAAMVWRKLRNSLYTHQVIIH